MQDILMYTKNAYFYYCYYGFPLSLVVGAIIYLFLENGSAKKRVWIYSIVALVFAICPAVIWLIIRFWLPMTEYWKVFYLLPVAVVLAYAVTVFWSKEVGRKKQWIVSAIFVIIIGMAMHFNASGEQLKLLGNPYKTSEKVVALHEMLGENNLQKEPIMIPADLQLQLCSYAEDIEIVEVLSEEDKKVFVGELYLEPYGELDTKLGMVRNGYVEGVVLEAAYNNEEFMLENGLELLANNEDYYIYTYTE